MSLVMCWAILSIVIAFLGATAAKAAEPVDFAHDVLPLLQERCAKCHTNGRYEGNVSFDTRQSLIDAGAAEPGDSADSAILDRITSDDVDYRMPQEGSPLKAGQ